MTYEELKNYLWEELEEWGEIREKELERRQTPDPEKFPSDLSPQETLRELKEEISRRKEALEKPPTPKQGKRL